MGGGNGGNFYAHEWTLTLKYSSFSTLVLANQFLRFSATLASPQPSLLRNPRFSATPSLLRTHSHSARPLTAPSWALGGSGHFCIRKATRPLYLTNDPISPTFFPAAPSCASISKVLSSPLSDTPTVSTIWIPLTQSPRELYRGSRPPRTPLCTLMALPLRKRNRLTAIDERTAWML